MTMITPSSKLTLTKGNKSLHACRSIDSRGSEISVVVVVVLECGRKLVDGARIRIRYPYGWWPW
ncbi:hypothetical protein, partial [Vibrio fluvialis]|uniref:hypothetical protein n=1 Tax=Vibrio fluvialis TaxID=676 RepID=UPI001EEB156B